MSGNPLDRYFRVVQGPRDRGRRPSGRLWIPAADVYRTDDGWIVKVDLAGIRSGDIEITLDGRLLRISGLRRDGTCGEGVSHYQLEITYSRFEKTIQFPRSIEHATVERDYHDGLLILRLREEEEAGRKGRARAASPK
jgi:HSP20 family protein